MTPSEFERKFSGHEPAEGFGRDAVKLFEAAYKVALVGETAG
jgi:hypothetical protein